MYVPLVVFEGQPAAHDDVLWATRCHCLRPSHQEHPHPLQVGIPVCTNNIIINSLFQYPAV